MAPCDGVPRGILLLFSLLLNQLPVSELRPQIVNNDQFSPGLVYNVPEHTTQFPVGIPEERRHLIPIEETPLQINNFEPHGEDLPVAIVEHEKSRGQKIHTSNFPEELEGLAPEPEEAIPGEPHHDYPVYEEIPRTTFSCRGKHAPAYYADVEAQCQVFHICDVGGHKHSFLCPNGSVFNQKYLVCDWWYDFKCDNAENLFDKQIIPTEIIPVSPNTVDNDKVFVVNNNDGFSTYVTTPNGIHDINYQYNDGFVTEHTLNQNNFDFPNTQIDIPQQIYTGNNYIPQNDIFHGAETGFPGRDILLQQRNLAINNIENNNDQNNNTTNKSTESNDNKYKSERKLSISNNVLNNQQQYQVNKYTNEESTTKIITTTAKSNNEHVINLQNNPITINVNNTNDLVTRKPHRLISRINKSHDFQNQNTNLANNPINKDVPLINHNNNNQNTFNNNNKEQNNINRQTDIRSSSNNNNNQIFQPVHLQNQPDNLYKENEKQETNKLVLSPLTPQQQLNYPPQLNI